MPEDSGLEQVDSIDTTDERKAFDREPDSKGKKDKSEDLGSEEDAEESTDEDPEDESDSEGEEETSEDSIDDEEVTEDEDENSDDETHDSIYQELKAKYPKLLKEIPELRSIIFREQEYTKVFPSIEKAKDALQAAKILTSFNEDVLSGNSETILNGLKKVDEAALESFVANFIPSVEKVSKDLYSQMMMPELKRMLKWASKNSNDIVKTSARNLHILLFDNDKFDEEVGLKSTKKDDKISDVERREREFEQKQFNSFSKDVVSTGESRVKRIISKAFEGSELSQWHINKLTEDIYSRINAEMGKDVRHTSSMDSLWEKAKDGGYTSEGKDSIIIAFLSRAKLLIPKIRQKVLAESKVSAKLNLENKSKERPKRIASSNSSGQRNFSGAKIKARDIDWEKTDERAMLDGKVTMRK